MTPLPEALAIIEAFIRQRLAVATAPLVVGLCGAQGSGKSTVAAVLAERISGTAVLSLDDLYLPLAERERLAEAVHPLLKTRGVPGTHDVALGEAVLADLRAGRPVKLPRFDKATDDRAPESTWPEVEAARLVIFEGWCVGARPQPREALAAPVNDLERTRDADGVWRRYANDALAGPYRGLFDGIGFQALLLAPSFDVILGWRRQQEHERIDRGEGGQTDAQLAVFVQYYERLTRWLAEEMPARADAVARLDKAREVVELTGA